jgi:hypothetical protein
VRSCTPPDLVSDHALHRALLVTAREKFPHTLPTLTDREIVAVRIHDHGWWYFRDPVKGRC